MSPASFKIVGGASRIPGTSMGRPGRQIDPIGYPDASFRSGIILFWKCFREFCRRKSGFIPTDSAKVGWREECRPDKSNIPMDCNYAIRS
jgi:hypothetical protein